MPLQFSLKKNYVIIIFYILGPQSIIYDDDLENNSDTIRTSGASCTNQMTRLIYGNINLRLAIGLQYYCVMNQKLILGREN